MRRQAGFIFILLLALALVATGCSKSKDKEQELRTEIAQLEAQLKQAENRNKDVAEQAEKAALKAAEDMRQLEETLNAFKTRLIHNETEAFKIDPAAPAENGWLLIDGERTFTLLGHANATKVSFYWADGNAGMRPQLLAEDTNGRDGWTWKGILPFSTMKAFWAEAHYPGNIKIISPVLPIKNAGK